MGNITREHRETLLQALGLNTAHAETTPPRIIFPVAEHLRALEWDVALIVGDRGAGKTQLKNALNDTGVRDALVRHASGVRVPSGYVEWRTGWPLGTGGPDSAGWRALLANAPTSDDRVAVWIAYLARTVADHFSPEAKSEIQNLLNVRGSDPRAVLASYRDVALAVTAALDDLDEALARSGRWLFVSYDELDTIVVDNWEAMGDVVRALISFWAAYARRWKRLRPKLFLRSDFYKHHRDVAGADVAKIAGNRVELHWSDKNLYGALLKQILNKEDASGDRHLWQYFSKSVKTKSDPVLGEIPILSQASDAKPFIDRLIAEYMGANRGKGLSFRWILDHLRDGNEHALPRSLVLLVELAAGLERDQPRATGAHLLHHVSVRNALDKVSTEYVLQARTHELRWLEGLATRLQGDREVPWTRREIMSLLKNDFDGQWSKTELTTRPPGATPEELLENLIELGVLRERANDQFDVPDLYLQGLELRRRGGVAKK